MTRRGARFGRALAVLAITVASVPRAGHAAEPDSTSQSLVDRGVELRRLGKNREALELFERAYGLLPTPRTGAQVALAHQALGDWALAEQGLVQALRADHDRWIALYRDALESALATVVGHLAWLRVHTNVPEGEVVLNGVSRYDVPVSNPLRVPSGTLEIEVHATGYLPSGRTIEVAPGAEADETFALEPPPSGPVGVSFEPPSVAPIRPSPDTARRARPPADAYVALAGAGVLAGAGIAAWRVREDNVAVYDDDSRCLVGTLTRAQQCSGRIQVANIALGLEIGAFAAAIAGTAFGAWRIWGASSPSRVAGSCGPAGLGIACGGQF